MSFTRVLIAAPAGTAGGELLDAHVELLRRLLPGASFERTDPALAALGRTAAAARSDLLVLGAGGGTSAERRAIADVVMCAPCSVWVTPGRAPDGIATFLTPVDFSERSAEALTLASHLVRAAGGERCQALHVVPDPQYLTFEDIDSAAKGRAERALATFIARVDEEGVEVEPLVVESADTASAIARVAEKRASDVIVMTTRGRTRLAGYLLPSISARVIALSRTAVLAIKHHGAQRGVWDVLRDRRFRERGGVRFN
jgi:SulP family sulfate permease